MSDIQDHPEYRGLLAAVRAAPDDDLPRLVLADWLEEHDSPDWAEFIRSQCMLDRFPHAARIRADTYTDAEGVLPDWQQPLTAARRVRELWPTVARELFTGELNEGQTAIATWDGRCIFDHPQASRPEYELCRGFVELVVCSTARWMGEGHHDPLGPVLFVRQPVREVVFTDREWNGPNDSWFAYGDVDDINPTESSCLPWCLAVRVDGHTTLSHGGDAFPQWYSKDFPTREAAHAALSRAAIAWAEEETGA